MYAIRCFLPIALALTLAGCAGTANMTLKTGESFSTKLPYVPDSPNARRVTFKSTNIVNFNRLFTDESLPFDQTIAANLVFPSNMEEGEKVGALVYVHGSGGPQPYHGNILRIARELGLATLQTDSFGPRGVDRTIGNQTKVTAESMAADALAALKYLAADPRIDADKIFIAGSSKGGTTALMTAWNKPREIIAGDLAYRGHISIYPSCMLMDDAANMTDADTLIVIGDLDQWNAASLCTRMLDGLEQAGVRNWKLNIYPGAAQSFDMYPTETFFLPNALSYYDCIWGMTVDGYFYEKKSGNIFQHPTQEWRPLDCIKKGGIRLVRNDKARKRLFREVRDFLAARM